MMTDLSMPVGYDNFAAVREKGCYYTDKTMLIKKLVSKNSLVSLITRPRRFGKSLNMSMLDCFFDITRNNTAKLFDGLAISGEKDICDEWQGQYPTIFLSFKDVKDNDYPGALSLLMDVFSDFCDAHSDWENSDKINDYEKKYFFDLHYKTISEDNLKSAIMMLTRMAFKIYGKKVILLLDEYDVPLSQVNTNRYYSEIINVMRTLYGKALKGNPFLEFAVITGCLRIAKESIFTGLNNPDIDSISDERGGLDEYFGFTDTEIDKLLSDTGLSEKKQLIKEWYDGYRFGDVDVYCPWDVVCYVSRLLENPNASPKTFWANTTGSDVIRPFLSKNRRMISGTLDTLIGGGTVTAKINEKMTYGDMDINDVNSFWSLLYLTGYLTPVNINTDTNEFTLKIPNKELKIIFKDSVSGWFESEIIPHSLDEITKQMWACDAAGLTKTITDLLTKSISGYDYSEAFYHAFILGIVTLTPYYVKSNRETGEGRTDIYLVDDDRVVIIEFKTAETVYKMGERADDALAQIKDRRYAEEFIADGYPEIIKMGVGFFKKRCVVKMERVK